MSEPERLGRALRRERRRAAITQLLDGPAKPRPCGQAKAAARARTAKTAEQGPPKDDRTLKDAARELQRTTGQKYSVCLAEVRSLAARDRQGAAAPAGDLSRRT